jgi:hypothetical protein
MRHISWFILIIFFPVFSSCIPTSVPSTAIRPTITYNPFATFSPTPFRPENDTPIPPPSETINPDVLIPSNPRTKYVIDALLDYHAHTVSVDEKISYLNTTGIQLDQLVLAVESNLWNNCFVLESVAVNGETGMYTLRGHRLEILLTESLAPDSDLNVTLQYLLNLPAANSFHLFGYKTNQINLIDWYPFIVPFIDGWLLHEPSEVGEYLVYDAVDYDVSLVVIPSMTVAASAPLSGDRYLLESARTFVLSASPDYQTTTASLDGVSLTGYYFATDKISGETTLQESAKALSVFSDMFGAYTHPSLSIVEADFFDGMEYDGLFFLGRHFYTANDGTKLNFMVDLAVHETAHQWWFSRVGSDQALDPWLDEALSTYSEYLFYEKVYPGVAETWWQFRVNSFFPIGDVDSSVYTTNDFQAYANSVYLRGAQFLRDLRSRIGEDVFFAFLKDYAAQMMGKVATTTDFFRILSEHTDLDITDLVQIYFKDQ